MTGPDTDQFRAIREHVRRLEEENRRLREWMRALVARISGQPAPQDDEPGDELAARRRAGLP